MLHVSQHCWRGASIRKLVNLHLLGTVGPEPGQPTHSLAVDWSPRWAGRPGLGGITVTERHRENNSGQLFPRRGCTTSVPVTL